MTLKFPKPVKRSAEAKKKECDTLFSKVVRFRGVCELKGLDNIRCGGGLQCMHIQTRGVYAIRWDFLNAVCGCAGHHVYYTYHPKEWWSLIEQYFPQQYRYVMRHKNDKWDKDYEKVLKRLKRFFK